MGNKKKGKVESPLEENKLYMYFIKNGKKHSKSISLEGEKEQIMKGAIYMAKAGILSWANFNGEFDKMWEEQRKRFEVK